MAKHTKLYDKSPKLERNEDGDMEVNKGGDKAGPGKDGSSAEDGGEVKSKDPHQDERNSMMKRHEEELIAMHERHKKDIKEMHRRHTSASGDKGKTGEGLIEKTEDKKED